MHLLRFLGFHVSWAKVLLPSQIALFLGIIIDTLLLELCLPEGKIEKTLALLNKVNGCTSISRKNLERLTGLLGHCATVIRGGHTFCRQLYNLHEMALKNHLKVIRLSCEAREDIVRWLRFIRTFNGRSTVKKPIYGLEMISDSSMLGYAVYLGIDSCYGNWDGEYICSILPVITSTRRFLPLIAWIGLISMY